ncbi:MAG: PAS-domain containing protein [Gammaproteobacteria bacterium]|nr:PAS-domain containing protein [Gammaproteobacteria bacterium]
MTSVLSLPRHRIDRTLIAGIALLSLLVMLGATVVQFYRDYQIARAGLMNTFDQARRIADSSLSLALWTENDAQIQALLDLLVKMPHLYYAEIAERGQIRARSGQPSVQYPVEWEIPLHFTLDGQPLEIAHLRLVGGEDAIRAQLIRRFLQRLSTTAVEILALALFILLFLSHYLTRHLQAIARYVGALDFAHDSGDLQLNRPTSARGEDELDIVVANINQTRRKLMGLYADEHARSKTALLHLEYALANMTEGLALMDAEGMVLLANSQLNALYNVGNAPLWVEGQPLAAINAALIERMIVIEGTAIETAADMRLLERRLSDGRWVLVRDRRLPSGRRLQLHTEITLLKQRELDLQRSNADLEQFAYVASHDLQEPLRMITGYLQLLERRYWDKLDDSAREFIAIAVQGAKRMQQLILDLLTFSRISTRSQVHASTDMEQVLSEILANLEAAIHEHAALIQHDPLPTVAADPGQMRLLLQNLLTNALRFHKPDQPPQITISAKHLEKTHLAALDGWISGWVFSVCDQGIGIEARFFERIFVIFQRLHTQEEYPGTGIGLALCKKIIERHGGRIWVESTPNQGTCFHFFLADHYPSPTPLNPASVANT